MKAALHIVCFRGKGQPFLGQHLSINYIRIQNRECNKIFN